MNLLGRDEENFLRIAIEKCKSKDSDYVYLEDSDCKEIPNYHMNCKQILNNLIINNYIGNMSKLDITCGTSVYLTSDGYSYFEDKVQYIERQKHDRKSNINIGTLNATGSTLIMGDANNSTFIMNNAIQEIERQISQRPMEEQQELRDLLDEAKELIENIESTRQIPKNGGFIKRLGSHLDKNKWFYSEIVKLLGSSVVKLLLPGQ